MKIRHSIPVEPLELDQYLYRYTDSDIRLFDLGWSHKDPQSYRIIKRTPQGCWISLGFGEKKFVRLSAYKRFAHKTKEEAFEAYLLRKRRQIKILSAQLRAAQELFSRAKTIGLTLFDGNPITVPAPESEFPRGLV